MKLAKVAGIRDQMFKESFAQAPAMPPLAAKLLNGDDLWRAISELSDETSEADLMDALRFLLGVRAPESPRLVAYMPPGEAVGVQVSASLMAAQIALISLDSYTPSKRWMPREATLAKGRK